MSKKSATEATEPAAKRTRSMGTIMVERLVEGGAWKPIGDEAKKAAIQEALEFSTTAKAEKWIEEHGEDGACYRVMREVLVFTVKSESVRKVSLFKK